MRVKVIPIEENRGCGYRIVGKIYICGEGLSTVCDNLPYSLEPCGCCGYEPQFTRGFSWLKKSFIKPHPGIVWREGNQHVVYCDCPKTCPICMPGNNYLEQYGLMWVGAKYYTPEEFISESNKMGVSKAINKIPKDLILGKTWVVLAHKKVPKIREDFMSGEPDYIPAIFYAFIPKAYEMLIWEKDATPERIAELEAQGITSILVPDDMPEHQRGE